MKLAGIIIALGITGYCLAVVWAVGKLDAAGFNFRGSGDGAPGTT